MPQVDQIQIGTTTYDILQSNAATFTGISNDTSDTSATSWTNVEALASSETNGSIFTKISSMFKNIRYLYSKIGELDIGEAGTSVSDAIKNLYENKADKNHTHDTSSLETADGQPLIANTQTNATNRAASAKLVYDMNTILTSINNERSSYVTKLGISNNSTITLYHGNTSVSSGTLTTATSAAIGLLPKLANTTAKCLLGNGTWGQAGSTYANVSTAAPGLMPKLNNNASYYMNGTGNWTIPPNTNTTYGTNVGCYGTLSGTTLTLNTRNFRV